MRHVSPSTIDHARESSSSSPAAATQRPRTHISPQHILAAAHGRHHVRAARRPSPPFSPNGRRPRRSLRRLVPPRGRLVRVARRGAARAEEEQGRLRGQVRAAGHARAGRAALPHRRLQGLPRGALGARGCCRAHRGPRVHHRHAQRKGLSARRTRPAAGAELHWKAGPSAPSRVVAPLGRFDAVSRRPPGGVAARQKPCEVWRAAQSSPRGCGVWTHRWRDGVGRLRARRGASPRSVAQIWTSAGAQRPAATRTV